MRPNPIRLVTILTGCSDPSGHSWRSMPCTPLWTLLLTGVFLIPAAVSDGAGNADRGEQLYRANCYSCHGVDPAHDGTLGPAIQGPSKALVTIRLQKGGRHYPPGYKPKRETAVMPPRRIWFPRLKICWRILQHRKNPSWDFTTPQQPENLAPGPH